jgi:hypothetical protein
MAADLITNSVIVLVGCAVIWGLWKAAQPHRVFAIRIVDGNPQAIEGIITPAFLVRVREVAAENAISHGTINGYAYGRFIRLQFSVEITNVARQQLRNWWATFGWNVRTRRTRCNN